MGDPYSDPFNFLGNRPQYSFEPGISARRRTIRTNDDEDDTQRTEKQGDEYALEYQLEEDKSMREVSYYYQLFIWISESNLMRN